MRPAVAKGHNAECDGSPREHVKQEAADELVDSQRHRPCSGRGPRPDSPSSVNVTPLSSAQISRAVRDRDAVGVAEPGRPAQPRVPQTAAWHRRTSSVLRRGARKAAKALAVAEAFVIAEELRCPAAWAVASFSRNSRRNSLERNRTGRKKLGRHATHRLPSEGEPAAGHDHVHVRVMRHRRAPGMEHGGEADAGAEMLADRPRWSASSRRRP